MGLPNSSGGNRNYNIRQDRINADPERIKLRVSESVFIGVHNYSWFGIATESSEKLSDEYIYIHIEVDGTSVGEVHLMKVRETFTTASTYLTAFSVIGERIDVDAIEALLSLNNLLRDRDSKQATELSLNTDYRLIVLEIRDLLVKLQTDINAIEKDSFDYEKSALDNFEDKITERVSQYLSNRLTSKYKEIEKLLLKISQDRHSEYLNFFRENVGELMLQSAYASRAYFKPRGYAGDFEMMNHVYHREARGKTLFGKCLQRYFVDEPAGKAVRNREVYLRRKLIECLGKFKNEKIKILSVASGPAMEIQNLVQSKDFDFSRVEFHLLDQDLEALKFAQRKIELAARESNAKLNLKLHNKSIKNVIADGLMEKDFHLIYSAGLFDYFTDPVAMFAGRQLAEGLLSGGQLIIGNFSMNNPNQFAMNLIMDWNLIYRSPEQMEKLFGNLGKTYLLEQEEQSINLFSVITR